MPDGSGTEPEARTLAALLADLADDPQAPPSSVTAASVIAAARAAGGASGARSGGEGEAPQRTLRLVGGDRSAGPSRRRTGLIALVAAASVAAVAAVVIPLTLSTGSTTTSADGAREVAGTAQSATAPPAPAAEAAPAVPAPESAAADSRGDTPGEAGSAPAGSGAAGSGPTGSGLPDSGSAVGSAESLADAGILGSAAASCWPALSPVAAAALSAELPPGSFGPPGPLDAPCGSGPVAGAMLPGTTPATALAVRVSMAGSGACSGEPGDAGNRCVPTGDGGYVGTDPAGGVTVFVYGVGYEVAVGASPPSVGVPATRSGLTTEQLRSAGDVLLGALQ